MIAAAARCWSAFSARPQRRVGPRRRPARASPPASQRAQRRRAARGGSACSSGSVRHAVRRRRCQRCEAVRPAAASARKPHAAARARPSAVSASGPASASARRRDTGAPRAAAASAPAPARAAPGSSRRRSAPPPAGRPAAARARRRPRSPAAAAPSRCRCVSPSATTTPTQRPPGELHAHHRTHGDPEPRRHPVVELRMRGDRQRNARDRHRGGRADARDGTNTPAHRSGVDAGYAAILNTHHSKQGQVLHLYGPDENDSQQLWITLCVSARSQREPRRAGSRAVRAALAGGTFFLLFNFNGLQMPCPGPGLCPRAPPGT